MGNAAVQAGKRAAYPAYKPSGMDWVGDIPSHWDIHRLKHIASVQFSSVDKHTIEDEDPVRLCNYVDVYYNDFIREGIDFIAATAMRSEIDRFQLRHGDVLITKDSEAWDDIAVPAYVAEELDGVLCGYHLAHIRPDLRKVIGEYLFRAFRSRGVNDQFCVAANGITRFGLGKYWLDNGLFPVPPLDEQQAIAAFLDRETERIDALVAKKERQIELLQEKRTALISHAVTKGLNPNAKMKDSGIEWLGEIPEHWEVKTVWMLFYLGRGRVISNIEISENSGDYPVFSSQTENNGILGHIATFDFEGDYLTWTTDGANAGTVFEHHDRFNCTNVCGTLKAKYELNYTFFRHIINQATKWFVRHDINPKLMNNVMASIRILAPPFEEQNAIAAFLDRETAQIDALIEKVRDSIEMLHEYRIALISAAVTGKIDVRTVPADRQAGVNRLKTRDRSREES
jgi:type I restriction enzyme S subunit